jgi:hypothetical protein
MLAFKAMLIPINDALVGMPETRANPFPLLLRKLLNSVFNNRKRFP